jgi:hypothetical protein
VSIKLAPGVRVRASSRGVRASVGPRIARVHTGAGRTTLSSGIGPFTSSTSVGGRRRPASGGRGPGGTSAPRTSLAALERQARQAQREAARQDQVHRAGRDQEQAKIDGFWNALTAHEPGAVIAQLELAFEDNQSPAACMDVGQDPVRYATALVMYGPPQMIPDQRPDVTPGGRPTLRKRSKADRNALYTAALGSTVLATVKEGLAVAPSVEETQEVMPLDLSDDPDLSALLERLRADLG